MAKYLIYIINARVEDKSDPVKVTLHKILEFHLIFCYENFMETHSLRRVSGDLPETLRKLPVFTKFPHQENR